MAEDRELFKQMLIRIGEPVPKSATVTSLKEARKVAKEIGLPLIIRQAYTLGGPGEALPTPKRSWKGLSPLAWRPALSVRYCWKNP